MSLLPVGISGEAQYQISRSVRFNSADSAYFNRTLTTPTNNKIWTWSAWVKKARPTSSYDALFSVSDSKTFRFGYTGSDYILNFIDTSTSWYFTTTQVFRDPSAWYHIVLVIDTTDATTGNRTKLYINGAQVTAFSAKNDPAQNTASSFNTSVAHYIGQAPTSGMYFDGYLTEVNFIDGQALTPSSFGETDTDTGVWKPKKYTGSYSGNSFYLNFSDNSGTTSTTLGKDSSGLGNNWTPNNFSVTAGAGNDSLVDTPTPYGTDTGVGGEVRGNYATWNPLWTHSSVTLANGNLQATGASSSNGLATGTIAISSGKWYWESTVLGGSSMWAAGIVKTTVATPNYSSLTADSSYAWNDAGTKYNGQTGSSYGAASYTTNDVIGIAVDLDAGTVVFYKNGVSQGTAFTGVSGTFIPMVLCNSGASVATNFGQRPFAYTAPSGFKALCTQNLPEPVIKDGGDYFNTILYTGTGSSNALTGVGFQPDFTWIKSRSAATDHGLYDAVRGVQKQLESNTTTAETTETTGLTAFGSDGFTVGALAQLNTSSATYVAWNWKANGAGVSNTDGTITSTVSANTDSGFSVGTFAFPAVGSKTVGHGLGVAPSLIIWKSRSAVTNWIVYHKSLTATKFLYLNNTDAAITNSTVWDNTEPTSTVFTLGSGANSTNYGANGVFYCFAPIAGYSAFGSYTGNGSTDGSFIYTGFRPRWVLLKRTNSTADWVVVDTARSTYNLANAALYPNFTYVEDTGVSVDILSNGFKLKANLSNSNASGSTYIYAAFAESPFKYSLGR